MYGREGSDPKGPGRHTAAAMAPYSRSTGTALTDVVVMTACRWSVSRNSTISHHRSCCPADRGVAHRTGLLLPKPLSGRAGPRSCAVRRRCHRADCSGPCSPRREGSRQTPRTGQRLNRSRASTTNAESRKPQYRSTTPLVQTHPGCGRLGRDEWHPFLEHVQLQAQRRAQDGGFAKEGRARLRPLLQPAIVGRAHTRRRAIEFEGGHS